MSEDVKKEMELALKEMRAAAEEIKTTKGGVAELQEKIEKTNAAMDKMDKASQELTVKLAQEQKNKEALEERLNQLEAKQIKLQSADVSNPIEKAKLDVALEIKACELFLKKDYHKGMTTEERDTVKKYLRTDDNAEGGFLVDAAYDDMIIKPITEMDPIKAVARNKRIDATSLQSYLRASLVTTTWTGEGENFVESNSTYSRPEIPVHSATSKTLITNKELLAAKFNMDNEIMSDFRESVEQVVGASYVTGNGSHKPRGFTVHPTVLTNAMSGGGSSTFDYDDLIDLTAKPKTGYNGMFGMNRTTLAHVRKLQDGAGGYIFKAGDVTGGIPNQIAGYNYIVIPTMANIATDAYPVVFADWAKFYTTVDSWQAIMLRNPYKYDGKVQFSMEAWFGGDVTLPEAGYLLKTIA